MRYEPEAYDQAKLTEMLEAMAAYMDRAAALLYVNKDNFAMVFSDERNRDEKLKRWLEPRQACPENPHGVPFGLPLGVVGGRRGDSETPPTFTMALLPDYKGDRDALDYLGGAVRSMAARFFAADPGERELAIHKIVPTKIELEGGPGRSFVEMFPERRTN